MKHKKKPYIKMIVFGVLSISAYVILFENISFAMEYFTRGWEVRGTDNLYRVHLLLYSRSICKQHLGSFWVNAQI